MNNKRNQQLFILLFLVIIVNFIAIKTAFASDLIWPATQTGEITSPFGPRGNYGSGSFHYGVDIGYDAGIPVVATADGIIDFYGEASGFEYAAVIYHPNVGVSTLYGDIDLIQGVHSGQEIKQGDIIGVIGPTRGTSTGPHLHYEIHTQRYPYFGGASNGAIDPLPYLNGAEVSSDYSQLWENDTHTDWTFIADIALPIRDTVNTIVEACTKAVSLLTPYIMYFFISFATISLVLSTFELMTSNVGTSGVFTFILSKILVYGMVIFLILNWSTFLNLMKDSFSQMGAIATDQTLEEAGELVSNPADIIQKGANLVVPFFNYAGSFHSKVAIAMSLPSIILVLFMGVAILIMFTLIGIQVMLAYIEFYIICIVSLFDLIFAGFKEISHLRFVGNGINALFSVSMNLLWYIVFTFLLSMQLTSANFADMTTIGQRVAVDLDDAGSEAITVFMAAIKTKESSNDYYVYSSDGYGYGAYQISFTNWNAWVKEAGLSADYDWEPHSKMQPAWSPERQDSVARYKMLQYYEQYGSWRAVAEAWHGGAGNVGSGDSYADDVLRLSGTVLPDPTFDFVKALEMFVMTVIFFLLGNKISKSIFSTFATPGFRYYL